MLSTLALLPVGVSPSAAGAEGNGLTLVGNGYGHGHGLSQYGAQGAASKGRTYRQILAFYYRGLHQGRATGDVKVLITADTSKDVVVRARPGLTVRPVGSGKPITLSGKKAKGVTSWRLLPTDGGRRTTVDGRRSGSWKRFGTLDGRAEFSAGGAPITLHTPSGDVAYRGRLRSAAPTGSPAARDTVNVLPLDSYLRGVVPREVPASWKPAALKAQAVAARTYAAFERSTPMASHYQICDTSLCQVYGGYGSEYASTNEAIAATAHQILTTKGHAPAFTQFSASNGGWTSAGSQPYLAARRDPYDQAYRHWTASVSAASLRKAFPGLGAFESAKVVERDGHGEWGGRVVSIELTFAGGTTSISGDDFRSYFGLRSSWFKLT